MKRPRTFQPDVFDDRNDKELSSNDADNDDSSASLTKQLACTTTATTRILNRYDDDTSSPSKNQKQLLEHEICIQLALSAKQRHVEGNQRTKCTSCAENAELLSHYGDLLEHLLADPDTMETYFRMTSHEGSTCSGFSNKETNNFAEELVNKIRETAREKGYTLDARISDTMLFNSIRRFYNTQLRCAEDRLTDVTKNHAHDDEIISILERLEKQKFVEHDSPENASIDENNNTPRANNKSTGSFWGTNHTTTTTTTTTSTTFTTATTRVEGKSPQMDVEPSPSRKRCVVDMKAYPLPAQLAEEKACTKSPEEARHIKRSKTSHNHSNNNDDDTTTKSSSSSSSSESTTNPHQAKHQRRNEPSSSSSHNSDNESDKDTSWKARSTSPREGSYEFQVSERLREITLTEESMEFDAGDDDMATLLAFVRSKHAEGLYRSAIKFCHDTLQRLYQEACSIASQPSGRNNMLLKSYRETVAGVWCMYARFLHEIGSWKKTEKSAAETSSSSSSAAAAAKVDQRSLSAHSESATDDWRDYALATLASVTRCPLVGNHQDISVAMARILVPPGDGHDSCCHASVDDVSDALAACKDGIRRCEYVSDPQDYCPILLNEMDFHRMARYELGLSVTKHDPVSVSELQASFEAVMKLPLLLEPTSEKYYLRDGRAGVPLILTEMTRLDKLVNKNQHMLSPLDRKAPARSASSSSPIALEDVMDTDSTVSSSTTISSTKSPRRRQLFDDSEKVCISCSTRLSMMELEVCSSMCFECQNQCNAVGNLA